MTPTTQHWGATKDDWGHLEFVLGLGEDLLPVVSNPSAVISPDSKMQGIGKTPSFLNTRGFVVGIQNWTQRKSTPKQIDEWSKNPDLGICLQTRIIRAIDADVEDPAEAAAIREFIAARHTLPTRTRSNSSKFLHLIALPGDYTKRKFKTQHGIVEFLATGQQAVIAGTHTSGVRYEWEGGLPGTIPVLSAEEFETLWQDLVAEFAIEDSSTSAPSVKREKLEGAVHSDPVAQHLYVNNMVKGPGKDGRLMIECPFSEEHTSDTGDTATVYWPAHTGGYANGHFHCLHAHCEHRDDQEFIDAIGYSVADEFDDLTTQVVASGGPVALRSLRRTKAGEILPTDDNVSKLLRLPDAIGIRIGLDAFRDEIMLADSGTDGWRPFADPDYTRARIQAERLGFKKIGSDTMRDAVRLIADENQFDSAILWLDSLEWDGAPRVEGFFSRYLGAEDSEYARAVSRYMLTAMAGRVLAPGCKADMVPVLVGPQGCGKSSAVAALVPAPEHFVEVSLHEDEANLSRKMRGRLVGEIAELRGLKSKELESIKAFITRTHENWVPKWAEFAKNFPRRLVFIGTTNTEEFLADETGNRRWLPVRVRRCDVEAISHDRLQLWAEARELFKTGGVHFRDAERLSGPAHQAHTVSDSWDTAIANWLATSIDDFETGTPDATNGAHPLRIVEVLLGALKIEPKDQDVAKQQRAGRVLRKLGYTDRQRTIGGTRTKVWEKEAQ
jgi:hypothetical protein